MLSSIFLQFQDREMKLAYQDEKRSFYSRTLLILFIVMFFITLALYLIEMLTE